MTRRRPLIPSKGTAIVLGVALFVAGSYCLYDAWEGRGAKTPRPLRPFTWW
jgi:hypothetical protein